MGAGLAWMSRWISRTDGFGSQQAVVCDVVKGYSKKGEFFRSRGGTTYYF